MQMEYSGELFQDAWNGIAIDYNYYSSLGNGYGHGVMEPGGNHVQVLVNGRERHTLHRNHLPPL